MDSPQVDQLVKFFDDKIKQKKLLIVSRESANYDTIAGLIAMKDMLEEYYGCEVDVAFNEKPTGKNAVLLSRYGVEYVTKLERPQYIIKIRYGGDGDAVIDEAKWENDGENLFVFITPLKGKFDFSRVTFEQVGAAYETVIVFGCKTLSDIDPLYSDNAFLFESLHKVNINNEEGEDTYGDVKLSVPEFAISEIVYSVAKKIGLQSKPDGDKKSRIIQVLVEGVTAYLELMQVGDTSKTAIATLNELVGTGGNMKTAFNDIYSYTSPAYVGFLNRMFENVKENADSGVIWSLISKSDMEDKLGVVESLDIGGKIPFNITNDYKTAFVLYQTGDNETRGVLEVNDVSLNARDIGGEYVVGGNKSRVILLAKDKSYGEMEEILLSKCGVSGSPKGGSGATHGNVQKSNQGSGTAPELEPKPSEESTKSSGEEGEKQPVKAPEIESKKEPGESGDKKIIESGVIEVEKQKNSDKNKAGDKSGGSDKNSGKPDDTGLVEPPPVK